MRNYVIAAVAAVGLAASAQAVVIPDGTATFNFQAPPVVNTVAGTFTADNTIFTVTGTGGFLGVAGTTGTSAGTLNFSTTLHDTLPSSLGNFLTFGQPGNLFTFSVTSVRTDGYVDTPGSVGGQLYLLGTVVGNGYEPTAGSVTLTFNQTQNSAFSASASLAVPPSDVPSVPEPASWALMLGGFGLIGTAMRRRRTDVSVKFG